MVLKYLNGEQTWPAVHVVRVIEQCCFNSTPDLFNGQIANFNLKLPKAIESITYVKKSQSGVVLKQHCSITLATCTAGQVWQGDSNK